MPARNVSLTANFANFLDENVASGQFSNASEVVREGLRLLEQRQREEALKLDALRAAVEVGLEDVRQGRVVRPAAGEVEAYAAGLGGRASPRLDARRAAAAPPPPLRGPSPPLKRVRNSSNHGDSALIAAPARAPLTPRWPAHPPRQKPPRSRLLLRKTTQS